VHAEIDTRGRLVLERTPAGPQPIQIREEGSVAIALGLLKLDGSGDTSVANELVAPQGAVVEVDGVQRSFDGNQITDQFPGFNLELLPELFPRATDALGVTLEQPMEVSIRVTRDIEQPLKAILRFVDSYNQTLEAFNEELMFPGSLEGDRSLAAGRTRLIRAVEEPVPGGEEDESVGTVEDIGLEVRRSRQQEVSELTLRQLALFDAFGQPPSPLASAGGAASVIRSLGRIGVQQKDDGTLRVDRPRLEQSLREEPALADSLLREGEKSVLPRLSGQLSRLRDADTGLLARRRRLFESLQEPARRAAFSDVQPGSRANLQSLTDETAAQLDRLQSFLGSL